MERWIVTLVSLFNVRYFLLYSSLVLKLSHVVILHMDFCDNSRGSPVPLTTAESPEMLLIYLSAMFYKQ